MWLLLLFLLGAAPAWAEDLGELSANPFNPESTANPFGAGSPFKPDGLNNPFSPYGEIKGVGSLFSCCSQSPAGP